MIHCIFFYSYILFNASDSTTTDTKYCAGNKRCSVDIGKLDPDPDSTDPFEEWLNGQNTGDNKCSRFSLGAAVPCISCCDAKNHCETNGTETSWTCELNPCKAYQAYKKSIGGDFIPSFQSCNSLKFENNGTPYNCRLNVDKDSKYYCSTNVNTNPGTKYKCT